eukprot:TRINITY_DN56237_c0_g1_i1.p1 TRINITY_DN56237_c0_g1~~TRINITY_DN56237_c0_g1_i1.p1  ORF type:complete len:511 (-),score=77.43 TRINITY_DN56237_c0_g1_i1:193-1725(-)
MKPSHAQTAFLPAASHGTSSTPALEGPHPAEATGRLRDGKRRRSLTSTSSVASKRTKALPLPATENGIVDVGHGHRSSATTPGSFASVRAQRKQPNHTKGANPAAASLALERGLLQLREILAALPREDRRTAIEALSPGLRSALLRLMEVGVVRGRSDVVAHEEGGVRKLAKPKHNFVAGACTKTPFSRGGIGAVSVLPLSRRTGSSGYVARITIDGVSISSRCMRTKEEAVCLRKLLAALRIFAAGWHLEEVGSGVNWLQAAFGVGVGSTYGVCDKPAVSALDVARGLPKLDIALLRSESWRFRVLMDVRVWAGVTLTSRTLFSAAEAADLRARFLSARRHGWEAFRNLWSQCLSRSRRVGGTSPLAGRLCALDKRRATLQASCRRRADFRRKVAAQRRLVRLVLRLERCIEKVKDQPHRRFHFISARQRHGAQPLTTLRREDHGGNRGCADGCEKREMRPLSSKHARMGSCCTAPLTTSTHAETCHTALRLSPHSLETSFLHLPPATC